MKKLLIVASLWLVACSQVKAPEPVYPIPTPEQVEWQKMEQYAFVHFGLNTFNDLEWGYGDTPSTTFNPTHLDADQWVQTIKSAGMKAVILTAKHHDGFNLWQSKHTEYSVKNSPWRDGKGDMVRELIEACKKHNLKIGLYLSPWDRNHADYGKPEYVEYFQKQITELINEYCDGVDMFEYWFDGANGGDGYYGGAREKRSIDPANYYQYEKCVEIIHKKFPKAMIFGGTKPTIRWIGNESGWAGETNWAMINDPQDHYHSYPYGRSDGEDWLPGEVDVSIRPGWFYHAREDHQVRSLSNLVNIYYESVGRNANLLLNFPVSLRGTIHPTDSSRIVEWWRTIQAELKTDLLRDADVESSNTRGGDFKAAKVNDADWDSYWATEDGVNKADITFTFSKPTAVNRVLLQEYIPLGQRVKAFSIDYYANGAWSPVPTKDSMTTVGYKRIIRFENVTAEKLRVNFLDSRACLAINNIEAFCAPSLLVEPIIGRNKEGLVSIKGGDVTGKIYYTIDGSEPTASSTPYTEPFKLDGKAVVKAVSQDPASPERMSPVAVRNFDVLTSGFKVKGNEKATEMFDLNSYSNFVMEKGKNDVTILLGGEYNISGFTYLPNQHRGGGGVITNYQLWVGGKKVAEGEFSNIKANPIEQIVKLSQPVKASELRFVATGVVDGNRGVVAEFGLITE